MRFLTRWIIFSSFLALTPVMLHAESYQDGYSAVKMDEGKNVKNARVGKNVANKYMAKRKPASDESKTEDSAGPSNTSAHYLAIHGSVFPSDTAYLWGDLRRGEKIAEWNFGLTYRIGEWTNSMDLGFRFDLTSYKIFDDRPVKLSFLPVIMFPDASSSFPLYFGGGAGIGIFSKQVSGESSLALDYQLFAGARFFNVLRSAGFLIESGIKNHLFGLSDGQYDGFFVSLGAVFTF